MAGDDPELPNVLERKDHVRISIEDSGIGIADQHQSKIFDPYFTTKEKGSGLGLATSYSIIRNHDGLIQVRSVVEKGSVFTVYLPASETRTAPPTEQTVSVASRRGRILVMDDEAVVRSITGELIGAIGHEAAFAEDGDTAVALYEEARNAGRPFDAVILDLTIRGGLGGLETILRLREIDPAVKAVVSSGYADENVVSDYRVLGFKAFLQKPYDIDELQRTLSALVE